MLWRVTDIQDYSVWAIDGDIGELDQFYLDVNRWMVRYLVVDTGAWLPRRKVLVPVIAVQTLDQWGVFHLTLTRSQIRHCPPVDPTQPISRAAEQAYIHHYGLPLDWGGSIEPASATEPLQLATDTNNAPYLLSTRELAGLRLQSPAEVLGHVEDCLVDDQSWSAPYLRISAGHWLPGKTALLPTARLGEVDLERKRIHTQLTRDQICNAPDVDPLAPPSGEAIEVLDRYYQLPAGRLYT